MCTCASCEYTDSFREAGFASWPSDEPKGERRANAEYAAHVAHVWAGTYKRVPFKPGQTPIYPTGFGYAHPVTYNTLAIRWNARFGVKYVPEPEPVRKPSMLDLARQLRAERKAERQAFRKAA